VAAVPELVQLAVAFPSPHPLTSSRFEKTVRRRGTEFNTTTAVRPNGGQVPVLVASSKQALILYDPTNGNFSFQVHQFKALQSTVRPIISKLCRAAGFVESKIRWWELQSVFVFDSEATALRRLHRSIGEPPTWTKDILGIEMAQWGLRVIPSSADGWSRPFNELIPWTEVTIEPLSANPSKIYMRFVFRESTWSRLGPKASRLPALAERLLRRMNK